MNNHMKKFKNRIILILILLPSLIIAQEIETQIFDFGHTNLKIHGQPSVSEKSSSDKKNAIFYRADITINKAETKTNIYAEKAEMFLVDNKGRPQTIILQDAIIENNIMSALAKEAIILSDSGTIKFLTDKVVIRSESKESDILNYSKGFGKETTYTCQNGKVYVNGNNSGFQMVETCDNGVTTTYSCTGGTMVVTQTVSTFCGE